MFQETISIAREAFDELDGFPDERIVFYARIGPYQSSVRVMDSIWQDLAVKEPEYIRVHIKDGPGDAEASEFEFSYRF